MKLSHGIGMLACVGALALATSASAAVPKLSTVEGALTSAGGGAAADGTYDVTFAIYAAKGAKTPAWKEGPVKLAVKGGRFAYALGTSKALDPKALAGLSQAWLGIKIGADPELPRQRMLSTPYALVAEQATTLACTGCVSASQVANGGISAAKVGFNYAGSSTKGGPALNLACTGCVSVKEMKFDGNVDLKAFSLKAKNGTFTGDVAAGTVTATSFVGNGSKLTGIKMPAGTCSKAGEVVKGINADGTLKCVKAMDPAALPKDGLNEISNDLISNQFIDTIETSQKSVPIPDNQGTEAVSNLSFPNIGVAQTFDLYVHIENTDLSKIAVTVLPPNDKKKGWVLCDPCGKKDAKILKATYNTKTKPKSGDIGYWIGKNPQGLWNLKVKDTSFCIPQAPGNAKYCNSTKKTDGWIATWTIKIQTLSNQKIAVKGNQYSSGGVKVGSTSACNSGNKGMLRWTTGAGLEACNGAMWIAAKPRPVILQGGPTSHNTSNGWYYVPLAQISINTGGNYWTVNQNGSGNNNTRGRITIKVPGYYRYCTHLTKHVRQGYVQFHVNGKTVHYVYDERHDAYEYQSQNLCKILRLVKGDYLNVYSYKNHESYNWRGGSYTITHADKTTEKYTSQSTVSLEFLGTNWK